VKANQLSFVWQHNATTLLEANNNNNNNNDKKGVLSSLIDS
jgi:hypothetical protein